MAGYELAERLAGAEHDEQSLTQLTVLRELLEQLRRAHAIGNRGERRQRGVWARNAGDLVDQFVGYVTESFEVGDGQIAVAESLARERLGVLRCVTGHQQATT